MPASGTAAISLKTQPDDFAPVEESVTIAGVGTVAVTAEALPPDLRVQLEEGGGETLAVEIGNQGGPAPVQVSVTSGFEIAGPDRMFVLGHGERRTVAVRGPAGEAGNLLAVSGQDRAEVSLKRDTAVSLLSTISTPLPADDSSAGQDPLSAVTSPDVTPGPAERMRPLTVQAVSKDDATVRWAARPEGGAGWRMEAETLQIDGTTGKLQVKWLPMENVQFTPDEHGASAHLMRLQPGRLYVLRMTALDAQGQPLAASGMASLVPGEPPRRGGKAWLVLGAAALAGLLYWWRRQQQSPEP